MPILTLLIRRLLLVSGLIVGLCERTVGTVEQPGPTAVTEQTGPAATYSMHLPAIYRRYWPAYAGSEWTQEAHDAQRTGYSPVDPLTPWTLLWTWNGPDANGGSGNHFYDAAREGRTVAGANLIFVPAVAQGLYALSQVDGRVVWNVRATTFSATPAYESGYVYAGGANGLLYKIDVTTGNFTTYNAGGALNRGVLLAGGFAYVVTDSGQLHKIAMSTMTQTWVYTANSAASTGLAYSASRDVVIFGTADLYVHAVNNSNGTQKWRVKPSPNSAGFPNEYKYYWPVIAEAEGVVFLRMRLDHNDGLWGYPSTGGIWPNTNGEARTFLQNNPNMQNLFALNLDNGTKKFIPAVGYGGTEDMVNNQPYLVTGPVPVVRTLTDGTQVAYIPFRNGQSNPPDGRWDSHMGEMVLNNTTIPGLVAGDLRFVRMSSFNNSGAPSYVFISDEHNPVTMGGNSLFHAHWAASEGVRITNRSNNLGLSYNNPIATTNLPTIIRRLATCADKNTTTHYTTCGLQAFGDTRYWGGPGFWTYWDTWDPPTTSSYSDGMRPRYTYVTNDLLVVEGNGGELMVFRHSGS